MAATSISQSQYTAYARQLARHYARHRPVIQRILTAGFVVYIVVSSVSGFATSPRRSRPKDGNRPPQTVKRAAVCPGVPNRPSRAHRSMLRSTQHSTNVSPAYCALSFRLSTPRRLSCSPCIQVSLFSALLSHYTVCSTLPVLALLTPSQWRPWMESASPNDKTHASRFPRVVSGSLLRLSKHSYHHFSQISLNGFSSPFQQLGPTAGLAIYRSQYAIRGENACVLTVV